MQWGEACLKPKIKRQALCIFIQIIVYLCKRGSCNWGRAFDLPQGLDGRIAGLAGEFGHYRTMKTERHNAIRDLVGTAAIQNQDELRRKLRRRGFAVTQATLSRDLHELHLFKGPSGYRLANGNGATAIPAPLREEEDEDRPPSVADVLDVFGLRCTQAMNQIVIATVMGGAQPVAAALDYEEWPDVVGTIAGDDTVLVICPDVRRAVDVESRIGKMLGE